MVVGYDHLRCRNHRPSDRQTLHTNVIRRNDEPRGLRVYITEGITKYSGRLSDFKQSSRSITIKSKK